MLTSLKIRWLKWQIEILLKLRQLETRRSRRANHLSFD